PSGTEVRPYAAAMAFGGFPVDALGFYERLEADNSRRFRDLHKTEYQRYVRAPTAADRLTGARLAGGRRVPLDVVAVAPRFMARELLAPLGLSPVELRAGEYLVGTRIEVDASGATAAPGVWVAGNLADPQAQVVTSAAAELAVGAAINLDLVTEDASRA